MSSSVITAFELFDSHQATVAGCVVRSDNTISLHHGPINGPVVAIVAVSSVYTAVRLARRWGHARVRGLQESV